jgi:phosphatidate cytidylyltransferase
MKRLLTGIGLIALAFYLVFFSPELIFTAAALAMSLLCYREYSTLVVAHNIPNPGWVGMAGGLLILFLPQSALGQAALLSGFTLAAILAFVIALRFSDLSTMLPYVSCVILGALYTFAPWRFAIDLREESIHLLFFALALNWMGDSVAYYIGRAWGKHRLAPVVSPKKSWEGAVASVAGSVVFGLLYLGHFLPQLPGWEVIIMAVSGNVMGQFGDLAESAIKRGAGVKDSGTLLPGHGGMLDRVDSNLFTLPVVFAMERVLQFVHKVHA